MKGYGQRLLTIEDWDDESSQLVTDFVHDTGFKEDLSEAVFECLAYAVGKVSMVKYVIVESSIKQKTNSPKNINVDVTCCNIKDFYHCAFLKRENLYCVIFEAERYAGNPDFAVFRRKAEMESWRYNERRRVAYGIGFYNMRDRDSFLKTINNEHFMD